MRILDTGDISIVFIKSLMFSAVLLPEALFVLIPNIHRSELEVYLLKVEPSSPMIDYDRVGKRPNLLAIFILAIGKVERCWIDKIS